MIAAHASAPLHCSRAGCDRPSLCHPVFTFVFTNGAVRAGVRPDVHLCSSHRDDVHQRFRSPWWQAQFESNLPRCSAGVDWSQSRVVFEPE